MRVTTLIENTPSKSDSQLAAEWGLSLHIAFKDHGILFDMGSSGAFAKNAEHLSVDAASVDTAILSHHHFDHGGGLRQFFELNPNAKVHLGEAPGGDCFGKIFGFIKKYIGIDQTLFTDYPDRFVTVAGPTQILPDVFLLPKGPGTHPKPAGNSHIFLKKNGAFVLDDFAHEIILAIKEDDELVIFTGCSHNGILNMVDTVAQHFKGVPIKAVVGGFHLVSAPPFKFMAGSKREVEDLGRALLNYPIDEAYTGHCTGEKAFRVLKGVMGDNLIDMHTGSRFEV
jgi:7,8-dihydropterin-6-yl-methyl-4-(beta-D-ribofuranosyl)aminobenzene 5'-phosphate synthase